MRQSQLDYETMSLKKEREREKAENREEKRKERKVNTAHI